tara:strand:+ start:101 stop:283 length:183 start_codon:yes stop_codon:yes gene_type:complete
MNILDIKNEKLKKVNGVNNINNPLAEFLELCIQSGLQFENSERANLLDKAIDYALERGLI